MRTCYDKRSFYALAKVSKPQFLSPQDVDAHVQEQKWHSCAHGAAVESKNCSLSN